MMGNLKNFTKFFKKQGRLSAPRPIVLSAAAAGAEPWQLKKHA